MINLFGNKIVQSQYKLLIERYTAQLVYESKLNMIWITL